MFQNLEVGIGESLEELAAFDAGQELVLQRREQVHHLFELILSSDVDFAADTAEFLIKEAEALGLDLRVDLVAEIEVWESHYRLQPGGETFDESNFVVDENASILQQQKVNDEPLS
jgi:hypothetical protein